jgi:hypothetical protein
MGDNSTTKGAGGAAANIATTARHLLDNYYGFLRRFKVNNSLYRINYYVLKDIATHYWRDVDRLHHFHNMPLIDCRKIAGYLAYWICKLQPISVTSYSAYLTNADTPKFINETFALYIACGRINEELTANGHKSGIVIEDKTFDTLLYTMKYRTTSGDNLTLFFEMAEKLSLAKTA